MQVLLFLVPAVVLALFQAATLFSNKEFWRGSGRVGGGLSTVLLGVAILAVNPPAPSSVQVLVAVLILTGVITVASGARKFIRRNVAQ
jgi:hypothetical protein